MPIVKEKYSKAKIAEDYKKCSGTIRRWIKVLAERYKEFAESRQDNIYLSFSDYNKRAKTLTPLQYQCLEKHYGKP